MWPSHFTRAFDWLVKRRASEITVLSFLVFFTCFLAHCHFLGYPLYSTVISQFNSQLAHNKVGRRRTKTESTNKSVTMSEIYNYANSRSQLSLPFFPLKAVNVKIKDLNSSSGDWKYFSSTNTSEHKQMKSKPNNFQRCNMLIIMASLFISPSCRPSSRWTNSTKEQKPGGDKMNNKVKRDC